MYKKNNYKIFVLMFILVFIMNDIFPEKNVKKTHSKVSIVIFGDLMIHEEQIKSAYNKKTKSYNFDNSFKYIKDFFKKQDLVIGNLEFTFGGKPYEGFPIFSSPVSMAESLKNSGINCVVTANNHSNDRDNYGIKNTINVLDKYKIKHTGTFKNKKDKQKNNPLIISIKGIKIALLNYTAFTNIPLKKNNYQINIINKTSLINDIKKVKSREADIIIVYFHWGNEYDYKVTNFQKIVSEICLENGVDIIVGSHPHVIQKMKILNKYNKKQVIAYSLGNFLSAQRDFYNSGGAGLKLIIKKENNKTYITNAKYFLNYVYSSIENNKRNFIVIPQWYFSRFHQKDFEFIRMKKFFNNHDKYLRNIPKGINVLNYNIIND